MPLNLDETAERWSDFLAAESEGFWALSYALLPESEWKAARTVLRQSEDVSAVIVLQVTDLLSELFAEAWQTLPSRLASLAVRPPFTTCLVARQEEIAGVESRSPPSRIKLWHVLIELAKSGSQIALQTISGESTFEELPTSPSSVDHDDWLPELLISPPRREQEWLFRELRLATHSDVCGKVVSQSDATAVFAGLWLLHGDADASHRQSQSIEDEGRHRCGNFWHAIMHRQEPDYGNSKYWFRRVGQHPIFPELARRADELTKADGSEAARHWRRNLGLPDRWDPFAFVDWCEFAASDGGSSLASLARRIQFVEMRLLLRASFEDAVAAGR